MTSRLVQRVSVALERRFPEQRLFIKSDDHTRFVRLRPQTQFLAWAAGGTSIAWSIVVTAIVLLDSIGSGNYRAQAQREQMVYDDRLSTISSQRDLQTAEASAAQERFGAALQQISTMQSELLASEARKHELEAGLEAVQASLRKVMSERGVILEQVAGLEAAVDLEAETDAETMAGTLEFVTAALAQAAAERDRLAGQAEDANELARELDLKLTLIEERSNDIFRDLEDALTISVQPLDEMFRAAGLDPEQLISEVHEGYSSEAGSLSQLQISTMGEMVADDGTLRANRILDQLDRINLYRIAVDRVPLSMPVLDDFRYTSQFGPRWGRMHEGVDMAGPVGTPIYATADGVVTFAGWQNGYGRIIKVQHEFGIETRYPHLNAIRVEVGQRVSRGERIGDMGNSGRSTGSHLHYEIRVNGEAIDPMIYIRAGQEVL